MLARLLVAVLLTGPIASTAASQTVAPHAAVPVEPIAATIDAFRSHSVVALPDAHGNEQRHAFLISLIRDPRFAATVNDIVVEFGSARIQNVMDRFTQGEELPYESLILEHNTPTKVFVIWGMSDNATPVQPDVALWRAPSLALVRGTVLGAADFGVYSSFGSTATRFAVRDSQVAPIARDQWRSLRAEEQFDAVLYLGPSAAMAESKLSPALCRDSAYVEMRMRRIAIAGPRVEADKLTQYCAAVAPK